MKAFASSLTIVFLIVVYLTGCATCKSSDTVEQCRTKQRDHEQTLGQNVAEPPAAEGAVAAPRTSERSDPKSESGI